MRARSAPPAGSFLDFIRAQAPKPLNLSSGRSGWEYRLARVKDGLVASLGRMPETACDLEPEILGTLRRDGYAIDRLTLQTRPGVRLTANLYRPDPAPPGRLPAVLHVHGHWAGARVDPVVQSRCLGLVKLGYLCLAVDAFGAGERAVDPVPGAYHGGLVGASLWPTGLTLMGIQVADNRRAVDYLISRADVDPSKLAITGCSGGGNQTLYAGATDPRLGAVVPVCSIGTYSSYLGAACCVCEVNVDGLTYATTGDILALIAPRAVLVMNASQDAVQFSPEEASKSVDYAKGRFQNLGHPEKIRRLIFDSQHDYNRPMREALYGWLDLWLRGKGDGSPIPEPDFRVEAPDDLRCYPGGMPRPTTIVTIPRLALSEGRAWLASLPPVADHPERWAADSDRMRRALEDRLRLKSPEPPIIDFAISGDADRAPSIALKISPEPGLSLSGTLRSPADGNWKGKVLLLRLEGEAPADDPVVVGLLEAGWRVLTVDLRATGRNRPDRPAVRGIPDHDAAEWSLWIGRPLLGQWVRDAMLWHEGLRSHGFPKEGHLRPIEPRITRTHIVGVGPFGLVALLAAGLGLITVKAVGMIGGLTSFVGEGPWSGIPMGLLAPGLLEIGDIGHFAAMIAPDKLSIAGGVDPDGKSASLTRLNSAYAYASSIYGMRKIPNRLRVAESADLKSLLAGWGDG